MTIKQWLRDIQFRITHGGRDVFSVSSDAEVLMLKKNGRIIKQLRWGDIDEIRAEKKDGFTTELIFVVFHTTSGESLDMEELYPGFQSVIADAEGNFSDFHRDWYGELNGGEAFETRCVRLWKKVI